MGPLGVRLARFFSLIQPMAGHEISIVDHLRFPTGYRGIFVGSDLGAALWDTSEGRELLDLVRADEQVQRAYGGQWDQEDDARRTLANVAAAWSTSSSPPGEFAAKVEADVWDSLRRAEVLSAALAIVPHLLAPADGIQLPHGQNILAPSDQFVSLILSKQFVNYQIRMPRDPYCIFLANIQASRLDHPTWVGPLMAEIAIHRMKDAVWVSTGLMARIGHLAKFEIHQFPVGEVIHENPERKGDALSGSTALAPFADDLQRISARLGVLEGNNANPPAFEEHTATTLRTLRALVAAATETADPVVALLLAFAAADGALRDKDEPNIVVPARYGLLCGRDNGETRQLRKLMRRLDAVRNSAAHGSRPIDSDMRRLLAQEDEDGTSPGTGPWLPSFWDRSSDIAYSIGLDIIRRLYRAWLFATMDVAGDRVTPSFTRADVLSLLRSAAHENNAEARDRLRAIVHASDS
jgi:hypothetical protein